MIAPFAVVSLWDMLERYARLAADAVSSLALAEQLWRNPAITRYPLNPESVKEADLDKRMRMSIADSATAKTRLLCEKCDLQDVLPEIERLEKTLQIGITHNVSSAFRHLHERIKDNLATEHFYRLDRRDVPLYGQAELFGSRVASKFPKNVEDVQAAGNCLALQQPTACVFHLMRAMEGAVQKLGVLLKVQLDPKRETWFEICNRASTAVTNRPAKTKAKAAKNAALSAAVAHLQTVRLAWRNEVMHPKQSYTREEAHEVFNATRLFLMDLADLI